MQWKSLSHGLILCDPMNYTVHGILQATILEWVAIPFSRGSSQPRCPTLQVDSLPAEPQERPKNTRVGSLSLLQGIFPTQESNWGLLHCRQILYQLSYQRISVVRPKWKHKGKGILGNVVQPSLGDTSFVEYIKFSININTYWVIE